MNSVTNRARTIPVAIKKTGLALNKMCCSGDGLWQAARIVFYPIYRRTCDVLWIVQGAHDRSKAASRIGWVPVANIKPEMGSIAGQPLS